MAVVARVTTEEQAHSKAIETPIDEVAAYLQDTLGQIDTSITIGVKDPKSAGFWARGERKPHPKLERRLRNVYQICLVLSQRADQKMIRAWFGGMNPYLDDRAPAMVVAEEPIEVIRAAKAFLANG